MSKEDQVTQPQKTEQTAEQSKVEKPSLPKEDFFVGDSMSKWLEQTEMFEKAQVAPKKAPEPCDDPESECAKAKKAEAEAAQKKAAQERKPIAVYTVRGKEYPVYTEEERNKLAQMGADYTTKTQDLSTERKQFQEEARTTEERLAKLSDPLTKLISMLEEKKIQLPTQKVEDELESLDIDPEIKNLIKKQMEDNKALKAKVDRLESSAQATTIKEATSTLDNLLEAARRQHPFEELVDEGAGYNVTEKVFAGLITTKVADDQIRKKSDDSYKMRNMEQLMFETAKDLHDLQEHFVKKGRESASTQGPMTAEIINKNHPEIAKAIGQDAIANYLKEQQGNPPALRSVAQDVKVQAGKKGQFESIDDAIAKGLEDPEVKEGLDQIAKAFGHKK